MWLLSLAIQSLLFWWFPRNISNVLWMTFESLRIRLDNCAFFPPFLSISINSVQLTLRLQQHFESWKYGSVCCIKCCCFNIDGNASYIWIYCSHTSTNDQECFFLSLIQGKYWKVQIIQLSNRSVFGSDTIILMCEKISWKMPKSTSNHVLNKECAKNRNV